MFRLLPVALILTFAFSLNAYSQNREIPKGWKEFKKCGLSFLIPESFKDRKVRGIDSCVAELKSSTLSLGFDYGMYTGTPGELKSGERREELIIDGKKAILTTGNYDASIYIVTYDGENGRTALGMYLGGRTANAVETAKRIFQSIRFVKED